MELYTSLTRFKMMNNGGVVPPMTELTERAKALIDPAFTEGMGSLREHPTKGLQCPVRGCGQWFHYLDTHLGLAGRARADGKPRRTKSPHPHVLAADVRAALDIPPTAPLRSIKAREHIKRAHQNNLKAMLRGDVAFRLRRGREKISKEKRQQMVSRRAANRDSLGYRNLRNTCDAQLRHRLLTLRSQYGRWPTTREFGHQGLIRRLWGSWNNFLTEHRNDEMRIGA